MDITDFSNKAKQLIDEIKGICVSAGLGGDANEYKIVTQSFLYKFINDKFLFEINRLDSTLSSYDDLKKLNQNDYDLLMIKLGTKAAHLKPEHLIEYLFKHQNDNGFAKLFDDTLNDIAVDNSDIFSVRTAGNTEIRLFEEELVQDSVNDKSQHDVTARQLINKLANSKFEFSSIFSAGFDFFSTLFEYMIKDYNKDGGGKYAEYYTPHSIAKVMAEILVGDSKPSNVTVYDPAAGSGTLLMNIAHKIGQDKCTIYSEDISQKSSNLLRLNLILNNLSHSIDHIVQGNTITEPKHITKKFDFIVSNPPFDPQTSKEEHEKILSVADLNNERFPFGIPNLVSDKKSETGTKMYIYLVFLQHAVFSLSETGKAAIVVPTGFLTAQSGIGKKIRELLIEKKWLKGIVSMPPNIFATTGTNVSVLFIDKCNKNDVVLVDASKMGEDRDDGGKKRRFLSSDDENRIISAFADCKPIADFSAVVSYEQIKEKNYRFSAGHYFDVRIEYVDISVEEFESKVTDYKNVLTNLFKESRDAEDDILKQLKDLKYDI
jgi:type I restriction enzyme M protein